MGAQGQQEGGTCRGRCLPRVSQLTWSCLPLLPLLGRDPTRQCVQTPGGWLWAGGVFPCDTLGPGPPYLSSQLTLSPSLPEAQSCLPRRAGTPCVQRWQSRDRADVSPCSRGPTLVQESSLSIVTSQPGSPSTIPREPVVPPGRPHGPAEGYPMTLRPGCQAVQGGEGLVVLVMTELDSPLRPPISASPPSIWADF